MFTIAKISENLKSLRKAAGYSQKELAEMAGTYQATIAKIENEQGEPSFKLLRWYADHFDVSLDWIFGRTDKPQGKLYDYQPKYIEEKARNNDELKLFIEMCFDPKSPMNEKLKQSLLEMVERGKIE